MKSVYSTPNVCISFYWSLNMIILCEWNIFASSRCSRPLCSNFLFIPGHLLLSFAAPRMAAFIYGDMVDVLLCTFQPHLRFVCEWIVHQISGWTQKGRALLMANITIATIGMSFKRYLWEHFSLHFLVFRVSSHQRSPVFTKCYVIDCIVCAANAFACTKTDRFTRK